MLMDIKKRFLQNFFCLFHQHGCLAFVNLISGDWLQTINSVKMTLKKVKVNKLYKPTEFGAEFHWNEKFEDCSPVNLLNMD